MPWKTRVTSSGSLQRDLRVLAADEGQREEQAGDQHAERIEPAEERDDDRGETVARRDARLELADRAGDLDDAGEARERARDGEQRRTISWSALKPAKRAACGASPDDADLEALTACGGARTGAEDHDEQRQRSPEMQPAAFEQ